LQDTAYQPLFFKQGLIGSEFPRSFTGLPFLVAGFFLDTLSVFVEKIQNNPIKFLNEFNYTAAGISGDLQKDFSLM
jgi:hypothetical protein